jgi:hypothetical protein
MNQAQHRAEHTHGGGVAPGGLEQFRRLIERPSFQLGCLKQGFPKTSLATAVDEGAETESKQRFLFLIGYLFQGKHAFTPS